MENRGFWGIYVFSDKTERFRLLKLKTRARLLPVMTTIGYKVSPVDMEARAKMDLRAGDTVKVHQKIKEGDKTRTQIFEGLVIARKHGREAGGTFTVRRIASGVGTEKIFPLYSPIIEEIEVIKRSKVRRAKLYHIRDKATKEIRKELSNLRSSKDEVAPAKKAEAKVEEKVEEAK